MKQERVHERSRPMPGSRVHHEARWFVDDDQRLVFVQDLDRNRFRRKLERFGARDLQGDVIPWFDLLAWLD